VETKQYSLCEAVLRRLHDAGVLDGMVVAGSWCVLFYQAYFDSKSFSPTIRTRDIDLAIPVPTRFKAKVDVGELIDDLGFVVDFRGQPGHMRFMHPDLILEFLVPERGRGSDDALDIPELGVNAQRLRYLDLSLTDTVTVTFRGIPLRLPHPVRFALHKLIVAERRGGDKAENDCAQAVMVLQAVLGTDEAPQIAEVYASLPAKWRRTIDSSLRASGIPGATELIASTGG
jgi:hypothetical protein